MLVATRRSARNRRVLPLRSASPAAQTLARAVRRFRLPSHLFIAYVQFLLRPTQLQEGWRFLRVRSQYEQLTMKRVHDRPLHHT